MRGTVFCLAILLPAASNARPKTDVIIFDNGDRLSCEIKKLQRGKLTAKTDGMSTVSVKWSRVARLASDYDFQLELQSGRRYIGSIELAAEDGKLTVVGRAGKTSLDLSRVVEIVPLESSILSRIKGSMDAGYDFTQAGGATTWSASAELNYRTPRWDARANLSSNIKEQTGAERVNRQTLSALIYRFFQNRWFAAVIGQGEKNQSQNLDYRGLFGGGLGRRLVQTNRSKLAVIGGAAFSRERYFDGSEAGSNGELIAAITAETYQFDSPELDISTSFIVLPNLTTPGRYRLQANGKARIEVVKNLYWSLTLYESYDSKPPSESSRKNDFGLTTSLGWSFK